MSPKNCAGCTPGNRNVDSYHHAPKNATTGTPAALTAKPEAREVDAFDFWAMFALVVFAFVVAGIEGRFR